MLHDYDDGDRYLPQYTRVVYCWRTRRWWVATLQDLGGKAVLRETPPPQDEMPAEDYRNGYREKGGRPMLHSLIYNVLRSRAEPLTCGDLAETLETQHRPVRRTLQNAPDVFCEMENGYYGLVAWSRNE